MSKQKTLKNYNDFDIKESNTTTNKKINNNLNKNIPQRKDKKKSKNNKRKLKTHKGYSKYKDKKRNGFYLTTIPGNKRLTPIPFYPKTNELVLSKEFFDENQIRIDDGQTHRFLVEYYEITGRHDTISDNFKIEYIPDINKQKP